MSLRTTAFVTAGLVLSAGLWWLAWTAAATLAGGRMDAWMTQEAAAGRQWTCPGRTIDGFPGALRVHCARPTFRGEVAGHTADGVLEGFTAGVGLDRPGTLVAQLRGPLNLRAEDDAFVAELSWADLAVSIPGLLGTPTAGSIDARRFAFTLARPSEDVLNLRAGHLAAEADAATALDVAFTVAAEAVSFPTADPLPGLEGPAEATGQGVLVGARRLTAPTVARLEAWRQSRGRLDLARLTLRKGSFAASGTGTLALDEAHRPTGTVKAVVSGFEPIAARFGLPPASVQLGGLIGSLLGGGKAAPGEMPLPLTLAGGRLSIGPVPTGVRLDPLY